ncbi:MAG: molybdopterin molybdotransferase MoeA [Aeromicrobium sp.]|nr:MAG: molybdopterin molybdotransferase MoeA [Aeromicrobium sp.]
MRSVDEQLARVLAETKALGRETIHVSQASGRTLAQDATAVVSVPVFDNSAMDGYAVRFADVVGASQTSPVTLTVVADLPAGTCERPDIAPGQAARIMTGAPFPLGADTVIPVEETDAGDQFVAIYGVKGEGAHIRRAGEDVHAGDVVVSAGSTLSALELSAIASTGVAQVEVSKRPRVAVISTGAELVESGQHLEFGQIPESNSLLLSLMAQDAGAEIVYRGTVNDEVESLLARIDQLPEADVVVLSGGVGAGAYDVVKAAFQPHGDIEFTTVAMQPGKPQGFGRLANGALVFCLPGNPVSAAVSFETFVIPALAAMVGSRPATPEWAIAGATWRPRPGRTLVVPVTLASESTGELVAHPANASPGIGSHRSATLAKVQAWAVIPAGIEQVNEGEPVEIRRR